MKAFEMLAIAITACSAFVCPRFALAYQSLAQSPPARLTEPTTEIPPDISTEQSFDLSTGENSTTEASPNTDLNTNSKDLDTLGEKDSPSTMEATASDDSSASNDPNTSAQEPPEPLFSVHLKATFIVSAYQFPTSKRGVISFGLPHLSLNSHWSPNPETRASSEISYGKITDNAEPSLYFRQLYVNLRTFAESETKLGLQLHPLLMNHDEHFRLVALGNSGLPLLFRYKYLLERDLGLTWKVPVLGEWQFFVGSGKGLQTEQQNFSKEAAVLWSIPLSAHWQVQLSHAGSLFRDAETDYQPSQRNSLRLAFNDEYWSWSLESGTTRDDGSAMLADGLADGVDNSILSGEVNEGKFNEAFLRYHGPSWFAQLGGFYLQTSQLANLDVSGASLGLGRADTNGSSWGVVYNFSKRSEDHSLKSLQEDQITIYYTVSGAFDKARQ